jgi:glutathione S-transferase
VGGVTNPLRLYDYAASSNCYKVRLLLSQLDRPYERVPTDIFGGDTLTDDFAARNPLRMTPVLELPDGRVLQESAAILVYLAEGSALWPEDAFERAQALRWLVYEQTDIIPATGGLRFRLVTGRLKPDDADAQQRLAAGKEIFAMLDDHLATREFFVCDRYTVVDIAIFGYVHMAHGAGYDMDAYPNVQAWLERVRAQPRYMNDLEPYPANAHVGAGSSIYG